MPLNFSSNEKLVNGKNPTKPILQFTVTPPRPSGPSEAERKIEALTQQLEEEFEKEEESEYFGKLVYLGLFDFRNVMHISQYSVRNSYK